MWLPMLIFTIIYASQRKSAGANLGKLITMLPFRPVVNHSFWFLYTLCGFYLITPVLSRWLSAASKREISFYLLLWAAASVMPIYNYFTGSGDMRQSSMLYYISGYIGFYIFGYYLRAYRIYLRSRVIIASAVCLTVTLIVPACQEALHLPYLGIWSDDVVMLLFSCALMTLAVRMGAAMRGSHTLRLLASLTFGGYLIFVPVADAFRSLGLLEAEHPMLRLLVYSALVITTSLVTVYLLSRIPIVRAAVGFYRTPRCAKQ